MINTILSLILSLLLIGLLSFVGLHFYIRNKECKPCSSPEIKALNDLLLSKSKQTIKDTICPLKLESDLVKEESVFQFKMPCSMISHVAPLEFRPVLEKHICDDQNEMLDEKRYINGLTNIKQHVCL